MQLLCIAGSRHLSPLHSISNSFVNQRQLRFTVSISLKPGWKTTCHVKCEAKWLEVFRTTTGLTHTIAKRAAYRWCPQILRRNLESNSDGTIFYASMLLLLLPFTRFTRFTTQLTLSLCNHVTAGIHLSSPVSRAFPMDLKRSQICSEAIQPLVLWGSWSTSGKHSRFTEDTYCISTYQVFCNHTCEV